VLLVGRIFAGETVNLIGPHFGPFPSILFLNWKYFGTKSLINCALKESLAQRRVHESSTIVLNSANQAYCVLMAFSNKFALFPEMFKKICQIFSKVKSKLKFIFTISATLMQWPRNVMPA
jgi:hypothetical protein